MSEVLMEFLMQMGRDTGKYLAMVGGAIAGYLAGHPVVVTMCGLMLIDIVFGLGRAAIRAQVSSEKMRLGLMKKGLLFGVFLTVAWGGRHVASLPTGDVMAGIICVREVISVLEKAGDVGIRIPGLDRWLAVARAAALEEDKAAIDEKNETEQA